MLEPTEPTIEQRLLGCIEINALSIQCIVMLLPSDLQARWYEDFNRMCKEKGIDPTTGLRKEVNDG